MGFEKHEHCISPEGDDPNKIWRYMDFTKFVSLLENEELFFPRADNLEDPFEGSLPEAQQRIREEIRGQVSPVWTEELLPRFRKICTRHTFLSCWHMNEGESAAMWDLYLESDQGISIQSTYENFIQSITDSESVFISKVDYITYDDENLPAWAVGDGIGDTLSPFIHKRESFEHEKELRAIIHDLPWDLSDESTITAEDIRESDLDESAYESGRSINVDLDILIEDIRVAPDAADWIKTLVEDICVQYGLSKDLVTTSEMERDEPIY